LQRTTFGQFFGQFLSHSILIIWSLIVLVPLWTMLVNSLKVKREIYRAPFDFPSPETRTFEGFKNAWGDGHFDLYFRNSLFATVVSLVLILLLGALAAYALANWRTRTSSLLYLYFIAGLMVPIRLGTINIVTIVQDLNLGGKLVSIATALQDIGLHIRDSDIQSIGQFGQLVGLIPIYVAMGLPITAFVVTSFMRTIPQDLIDAARMDGASELRVFWQVMLPLVRPALATVMVFNMIPIWNDLWFPLILTRAENARTVTFGVSLLFGQYQTDWNAILSTLSMASVPVLILYLLMSKQFIKGLTAGAIKG
jgi:raffinose/stachyose/melibiose transport system permease protein